MLRKSGATVRSEAGRAEPLVSCIMPTADRRAFVPLAIRYFLRQDYENRELIILDDGSDPVSATCIPNIRGSATSRCRSGAPWARNITRGDLLARGEIIAHWDDDDWFAERRLSYQVSELLKQPRMTLTGFSRVLFYCPNADRAWEYSTRLRSFPGFAAARSVTEKSSGSVTRFLT